MSRKSWGRGGLLIAGALLGAVIAAALAQRVQLDAGRAELAAYAGRLLGVGEQLATETDEAVMAVVTDKLPACSDGDLALMRDFVYGAAHVKAIGRIVDGKLECSTNGGRLAEPQALSPPDISEDDTQIYVSTPPMISSRSSGFATVAGGVAVVLNPDLYKSLDEPPMTFSGLFYARKGPRLLRSFGHDMPVSDQEVIAGHPLERDSVFYYPVCAKAAMFCIVTAETRAAILGRDQALLPSFLVGGALLGAALSLILILVHARQRSLERQLRRAIRKGALTLAYQPVVDLDRQAVIGAEALVRWTNEDGEMVRPDLFVALAEEKGFVGELTRLVLRKALDELGDLLRSGTFRLTVNVTRQDLTDSGFTGQLERRLAEAGVPPAAIGIELTERSTVDQSAAIQAIDRLKQAGHTVYIDDFGTGYSSLAYLHRLAVDAIKIDRAFTQTVGTGAVTASVVPQILEMARKLELMVVVEGIETGEQADYFRQARPGLLGQGWLFGKPVPAATLRDLVRDGGPSASVTEAA